MRKLDYFLERVPREVKYYAIDLFEAVHAVILVLKFEESGVRRAMD